MKLHDVPQIQRGTKVRVLDEAQVPPAHRELDPDEVLTFYRIDGMYSYCKDYKDRVVHLVAWAEVGVVE